LPPLNGRKREGFRKEEKNQYETPATPVRAASLKQRIVTVKNGRLWQIWGIQNQIYSIFTEMCLFLRLNARSSQLAADETNVIKQAL
jgi:hypothetical protein